MTSLCFSFTGSSINNCENHENVLFSLTLMTTPKPHIIPKKWWEISDAVPLQICRFIVDHWSLLVIYYLISIMWCMSPCLMSGTKKLFRKATYVAILCPAAMHHVALKRRKTIQTTDEKCTVISTEWPTQLTSTLLEVLSVNQAISLKHPYSQNCFELRVLCRMTNFYKAEKCWMFGWRRELKSEGSQRLLFLVPRDRDFHQDATGIWLDVRRRTYSAEL